jgi:alpha-amylase
MSTFSVKKTAKFVAIAVAAAFALSSISAANAEEPTATPVPELTTMTSPIAKGSVGLQMFGYNWNSIARECTTTLGPEGVDWVLTLPPTDHIKGNEWWIHYQPTSYELNSDAGTRAEFVNMVSACKKAGVAIVTDAVVNHMAGGTGTSYSGIAYGTDLNFAGIYKNENFHRGLATTLSIATKTSSTGTPFGSEPTASFRACPTLPPNSSMCASRLQNI